MDADTGQVIDSHSLDSYTEGKYLVWDVKGRIRFRINTTAGPNATIHGVFLGPPTASL
jgi:hypothetical protein